MPDEGAATVDGDCDDADPAVNPDAQEVCDAVDNNCDALVDDEDDSVDLSGGTTWYPDADGDGYGDADDPGTLACGPPAARWVDDATDCEDDQPGVNPGATEICGGPSENEDEDCDGLANDADDSVDLSTGRDWYTDADGDGHGDPATPVRACDRPTPSATRDDQDCDDAEPTTHPGARDLCEDSVDNDCDGNLDEGCLTVDDADVTWTAGSDDSSFGYALAMGADLDGDGLDDLAVSSPYSPAVGSDGGRVYLLSGASLSSGTEPVEAVYDWVLDAEAAEDLVGFSVSSTDDVTGDGYGDLLVGALGYPARDYGGLGVVFSGPLTGAASLLDADLAVAGPSGSRLGWHLAAPGGDLTGDGVADLLFGAPRDATAGTLAGAVYLVSGVTTGLLDASDGIVVTGVAGAEVGNNAGQPGDLDGDGADDLLLGAGEAASVYALLGPITADRSVEDADVVVTGTGELGADLTTGDLDGDGTLDWIVGDPTDSSAAGRISVLLGPVASGTAVSTAAASVVGAAGDDVGHQFGDLLAVDFSGDGQDDLVVGARYADGNRGQIGVFHGPLSGTLTLTDSHTFIEGPGSYTYLGNEMSVGDVDGDGLSDLVAGAQTAGTGGEAYLFFGSGL